MKQMNNSKNCKQLKLKKIVYCEFKNCHRYDHLWLRRAIKALQTLMFLKSCLLLFNSLYKGKPHKIIFEALFTRVISIFINILRWQNWIFHSRVKIRFCCLLSAFLSFLCDRAARWLWAWDSLYSTMSWTHSVYFYWIKIDTSIIASPSLWR